MPCEKFAGRSPTTAPKANQSGTRHAREPATMRPNFAKRRLRAAKSLVSTQSATAKAPQPTAAAQVDALAPGLPNPAAPRLEVPTPPACCPAVAPGDSAGLELVGPEAPGVGDGPVSGPAGIGLAGNSLGVAPLCALPAPPAAIWRPVRAVARSKALRLAGRLPVATTSLAPGASRPTRPALTTRRVVAQKRGLQVVSVSSAPRVGPSTATSLG